jgi:hypothetical protein
VRISKWPFLRVPTSGKCENTVTFGMWPLTHFIHVGFGFGGQDCSVLQECLLPSYFQKWDVGYFGLLRAYLSTLFMLGCTLFSVASFLRWSVAWFLFMGCWWCWSRSDGQGPWCSPCITCLAGTVGYGSCINLSWFQCSDLFLQYSFCYIYRGCCVCSFSSILKERRLQAFLKNEIVLPCCSSTALLKYWHPHE